MDALPESATLAGQRRRGSGLARDLRQFLRKQQLGRRAVGEQRPMQLGEAAAPAVRGAVRASVRAALRDRAYRARIPGAPSARLEQVADRRPGPSLAASCASCAARRSSASSTPTGLSETRACGAVRREPVDLARKHRR
jgi:hypothetical protein